MKNKIILNPQNSVVVEACAGSGKTWLLVSRIVRLLLAGVKPGEILAITFTRKAAQEMQARLQEWLHLLAVADDATVRDFLRERALDNIDDALMEKARGLYRNALLAQPTITISTFHGWFMQLIQRAPLNSGVPVGMKLLERTSALRDEAWQVFADSLRAAPECETAQFMHWLFAEYGLHSTRALLENFVHKRAEWWAYTSHLPSSANTDTPRPPAGEGLEARTAVTWALSELQEEFGVDMDADPITDTFTDSSFYAALHAFAQALATGTDTQCKNANKLQIAWEVKDINPRFAALIQALYTQADEMRSFKPTKKQDAESFILARDILFSKMQALRDALTEIAALRMNEAALHCGAALLGHFQQLKLRSQQMDFTDLEWQVCSMLNQSECAEYMQYKLDSRYKHVLLDEFQDTNPLQWQILQSWFTAAAAVDSRPVVFVVGDPKQSIYRFRRADSRLFREVREFLQQEFGAHYLTQNMTRRNSPVVLGAVNGVFESRPNGFVDFEAHLAHHQDLIGHVEALPLIPLLPGEGRGEGESKQSYLRNPLLTPRQESKSSAKELEAGQFAAHIAHIVANWNVQQGDTLRRAAYRDIMVLVRKRTHLRIYEQALRTLHIPFLTSRRGGLLDTLEAEDIQALLTFLITPFADLELAQTLRSPLFACTDADLMQLAAPPLSPPLSAEGALRSGGELTGVLLAGAKGGEDNDCVNEENNESGDNSANIPPFKKGGRGKICSWWSRLQRLAQEETSSAQLHRAYRLLKNWLQLADKLPVHDLLDRIYFEGDLQHRCEAVLPVELRETVRANLQAFMEIALNVDAGRYPSLPRFLTELNELRAAENESPDEGQVGQVGNALRIYTVHEAKGLEAPIVWLLDANDIQRKTDSYSVLLDWQPNAPCPAHFSLFSDKRGRGAIRAPYFEADEAYALREEMNLLYVAMTRAKQALLVSGNGEAAAESWYGRIAAVVQQQENPLLAANGFVNSVEAHQKETANAVIAELCLPIPTGKRGARSSIEQRRGTWLHALLQHLTPSVSSRPLVGERGELQQRLAIPPAEMDTLWQQAQHLLALPQLQRFFEPSQYHNASNEMPYINAYGELKRIDRLVEFDDEVWVLDYKTGDKTDVAPHRVQMQEYRSAMQAVYAGKTVRCGLLFADGVLREVA